MEIIPESNRAKNAALLAKRDRENLSKNGLNVLKYYRSGWSIVEIAALTSESEDTAIRIAAIRNFIFQVNSIISVLKSHAGGLSTKDIAEKLNIDITVVMAELNWFEQSKIIIQKESLWIHKKYDR